MNKDKNVQILQYLAITRFNKDNITNKFDKSQTTSILWILVSRTFSHMSREPVRHIALTKVKHTPKLCSIE